MFRAAYLGVVGLCTLFGMVFFFAPWARAAVPQCSQLRMPGYVSHSLTSDGNVLVSWPDVAGVESFQVQTDSVNELGGRISETRDVGKATSAVVPFSVKGTNVPSLTIYVLTPCIWSDGKQRTVNLGQDHVSAPAVAVAPDPPVVVRATRVGRLVSILWTLPEHDGGGLISGYLVTAQPGGVQCRAKDALKCEFKNLKPGVTYTFTVQAQNSAGIGQGSKVQLRLPAAAKPSAGLS